MQLVRLDQELQELDRQDLYPWIKSWIMSMPVFSGTIVPTTC